MALLTKDERQSLSGAQRRALRRERRAERAAEGGGRLVSINLRKLRGRAAELVLDYAGEAIPGPDRMDEVLDQLVDEADDLLVWTWAGPVGLLLEAVDGPVIRALVRALIEPHVQQVYDQLAQAGVLEDSE